MDLAGLRAFLSLARVLHFGDTAAELGISQPALSQQISRLERRLGVQLFRRDSRNVALTEAGVVLANQAGGLLAHAERVIGSTVAAHRGQRTVLVVGFLGQAAGEVTGQVVELFQQRYPAVELQLATAEAAVRLKQTGAPVASIFGLSGIQAMDDAPETRQLAGLLDALNWQAGLGLFRDGTLRIPGLDPVERPDLAGSFDLIGFSFYSTMGIRQGALVPYPPDVPVSPLGYGIWADGLGRVLERLQAMVPGTPLLVAEYGIGTSDDAQRAAYLERGLQVTSDAIARGIDVRGVFHWTAVDNYEWLHGFDVQFGIIDRDRRIRPSARVLQREASAL